MALDLSPYEFFYIAPTVLEGLTIFVPVWFEDANIFDEHDISHM